jgi:hypothetical protein
MSWLGFDDLFLSASASHFMSEDLSNRGNEALVDGGDAGQDNFDPPVWIELDDDDGSAEENSAASWGGITILSSQSSTLGVPSQQVPPHVPVEILAHSHFPRYLGPLSISTTDSCFTSLSLSRPSSLASSLADLSVETTCTTEEVAASRSTSTVSVSTDQQLEQLMVRLNQVTPPSGVWYANYNEADWDHFRIQSLEILSALDEDVFLPDHILAEIIQREEALFWEKSKHQQVERSYQKRLVVMGEMALFLTTAALASFGVAGLARRR